MDEKKTQNNELLKKNHWVQKGVSAGYKGIKLKKIKNNA